MKTGLEKMRSSELYTFADPEVDASARHAKASCTRLQTMTANDDDYRQVMEELIPISRKLRPSAYPLCATMGRHCNWRKRIHQP